MSVSDNFPLKRHVMGENCDAIRFISRDGSLGMSLALDIIWTHPYISVTWHISMPWKPMFFSWNTINLVTRRHIRLEPMRSLSAWKVFVVFIGVTPLDKTQRCVWFTSTRTHCLSEDWHTQALYYKGWIISLQDRKSKRRKPKRNPWYTHTNTKFVFLENHTLDFFPSSWEGKGWISTYVWMWISLPRLICSGRN